MYRVISYPNGDVEYHYADKKIVHKKDGTSEIKFNFKDDYGPQLNTSKLFTGSIKYFVD